VARNGSKNLEADGCPSYFVPPKFSFAQSGINGVLKKPFILQEVKELT
jgi:hypothetical protein